MLSDIFRALDTGGRDRRGFLHDCARHLDCDLALARIGTELNSGLATLQWLVDGYALVFTSLLLGAGALGDRFGAKGTLMCAF